MKDAVLTEAYLELCETSMMELSWWKQLKVLMIFIRKLVFTKSIYV